MRELGTFWQLHGVLPSGPWHFHTRWTMEQFPGIQWIAWVPADSTQSRFEARDTVRVDSETLNRVRQRIAEPSTVIDERWSDGLHVELLLPVRSAEEGVSMLAAAIRVDSLWLKSLGLAPNFGVTLVSDRGNEVALRSAAADKTPGWMKLRRGFTSPGGRPVQVDLVPSAELVRQIATPWPHYFLVTGLFLSVAIGVLLFQSLRSRHLSEILANSNRVLDQRIAELSRRDRELRDVNEALEQRVRERTVDLSEALREVETLTHSTSHDLRSPIAAILSFSAMLEEDYGPQMHTEARTLLERIRTAGEHANHLLNSLMEYASSGASPLRPSVIDVRQIAESAYTEALAGEESNGEVKFGVDHLPPAFGDPEQTHRVFVNLLGNALKYSRGRVLRTISVGGTSGTTECTYWVKDNGHGFESSRSPEIFEPFRRLQGSHTEGVGLGLAIVAKTVRRQGGRVWADSDGKTGATFYFTLPSSERLNGVESGRSDRG